MRAGDPAKPISLTPFRQGRDLAAIEARDGSAAALLAFVADVSIDPPVPYPDGEGCRSLRSGDRWNGGGGGLRGREGVLVGGRVSRVVEPVKLVEHPVDRDEEPRKLKFEHPVDPEEEARKLVEASGGSRRGAAEVG